MLIRTLLSMKYNENEALESHFLKFDKNLRELQGSGQKMDEAFVVSILLLTLPKSFDSVVMALETVNDEKLSVSFVKSKLLNVEFKRKSIKGEVNEGVAFAGKNNYKYKFNCYNCGRAGHKRSECRVKKQHFNKNRFNFQTKAQHSEQVSSTDEIAFHTEVASLNSCSEGSIKFYLDSGASEHMVNRKEYFTELRKLEKPIKIAVAKQNEVLYAYHSGSINVLSNIDNNFKQVTINDVLLVPDLLYNLFSIRKVEEKAMKVIFQNGMVQICKDNKIVASGSKNEKMYEIKFKLSLNHSAILSMRQDQLWHYRLAHSCKSNLSTLVNQNLADGIDLTTEDLNNFKDVCDSCMAGKQSRLPFKEVIYKRLSRPLELIHSDLCGPITPSTYDNKRYFLTLIDDFTHFTIIYLLSNKSDVTKYVMEYEAKVTAKFNSKIHRFRCDNGGEYVSTHFKNFCIKQGISLEYTTPYTPELNGVAERMNRTILEKARCIIYHSNVNKKLWGEAVLTSAYVTNRCPCRTQSNRIPAEMWSNKRVDLSKLKIFGCKAFIHVPVEKRLKLDSKTKIGIMIGYNTNGYRLWDDKRQEVIISRNVVFDENIYPMKNKPCTQDDMELDDVKVDDIKIDDKNLNEEEFIEESMDEHEEIQNQTLRIRRKPAWHKDYDFGVLALNAESCVEDLPDSYESIIKRSDKDSWLGAINDELNSLEENKTWTITELPKGKKQIDSKWIFKIKRDSSGNILNYKARLVAKGFQQKEGEDFVETYAPVAKLTTIRIMLALINEKSLYAHQMDVKTAFLNGFLKEEVYMKLPQGYHINQSNKVCKLDKALYGLKQASKCWNDRFHNFISNIGFKRSDSDYCLYTNQNVNTNTSYLLIYVDDIIVISTHIHEMHQIKKQLMDEFKMTDGGELNYFLGLHIERTNEGLVINQIQYLKNLLKRFNMEEAYPTTNPMEIKLNLSTQMDNIACDKPYKQLIGCIMYAMIGTRPDLCYSVSYFSRFQSHPTELHWKHLKRVLRYIKGTINYKLHFSKHNSKSILDGFVDADWGNDINDRRSTTGYFIILFGNTISWSSKKQRTVAISSTESEYMAISDIVTEILWIKSILVFLQIDVSEPTIIHEDNQSSIKLAQNPEHHKRTKHIDVKFHFIREKIQNGDIQLKYVNTLEQLADILTKSLPNIKLVKTVSNIGLL